jgi:hypothetical protein
MIGVSKLKSYQLSPRYSTRGWCLCVESLSDLSGYSPRPLRCKVLFSFRQKSLNRLDRKELPRSSPKQKILLKSPPVTADKFVLYDG